MADVLLRMTRWIYYVYIYCTCISRRYLLASFVSRVCISHIVSQPCSKVPRHNALSVRARCLRTATMSLLHLRVHARPLRATLGKVPTRFLHQTTTEAPVKSRRSSAFATFGTFGAIASLTAAYLFWPTTYRGAPTVAAQPLSLRHFTPLTVTASEDVGPLLKLITLHVPPEARPDPANSEDPLAMQPIWSLYVKDDDLQVERPYTPLEGIDANGNVKLWVKRYPRGEVARWLHTKRPGDLVEVRGPQRTLQLNETELDEIVMVRSRTVHVEKVLDCVLARFQAARDTLLSTNSCTKGYS